MPLAGGASLLAATMRRIEPLFGRENILVVTTKDQERATREELRTLGMGRLLLEPEPKNTCGAIALAAAWVCARAGEDAMLAVMPADHYVTDERMFRVAAERALGAASHGIVTIGIRPSRPETGYGYIRMGPPVGRANRGARHVLAFVEKPDARSARRYVRSGDYLWNAGLFFLSAGRMRQETARHLPKLSRLFERLASSQDADRFQALLDRHYASVEAISVDYGIMEKAQGLLVIPAEFGWTDVGSWSAMADLVGRVHGQDDQRNVAVGDTLVLEGSGNFVLAEPGAPFVGAVGVHDLVVVATADGVLVIPRDQSQDVRKVVDALKAAKRTELVDGAVGTATSRSRTDPKKGRQGGRRRG
jgi:mannose-1-phosphate guanylyltransferase